jgi:glycosyltransferase involved in cell wall biosynthesis
VISLIVSTIQRVDEPGRLLCSLEEQTAGDFEVEVIVVDQNADDRLVALLRAHPRLAIRHLRSAPGLSRARNVGLRAARGSLIAIPDDDCWYPQDLLASVLAWFDSHPLFGLLGTAIRTGDDRPSGPRSPALSCRCTRSNVWRCAVSTALFFRRTVADSVGDFNEEIGVGAASPYQSGEETDYVLRAFENGFEMWYEPSFTVHHPPLDSMTRLRKTSYPFALGTGRVLGMHGYPLHQVGAHLVRSFGGAAVSLCRGELDRALAYALRGAGQLAGYVSARRGPVLMPTTRSRH